MIINKNLNPIVTELVVIRSRKLNVSTILFTKSCLSVSKDVRINCIYFFIMKIQTKESFNKSHLIIHQVLPLKTFWIFTKNVSQNYVIHDKLRNESYNTILAKKQQKYQVISSSKIDKYEYLTWKEILPSNQIQFIEQGKFSYSPLGKTLEKQTRAIEDAAKNETKAIEDSW